MSLPERCIIAANRRGYDDPKYLPVFFEYLREAADAVQYNESGRPTIVQHICRICPVKLDMDFSAKTLPKATFSDTEKCSEGNGADAANLEAELDRNNEAQIDDRARDLLEGFE